MSIGTSNMLGTTPSMYTITIVCVINAAPISVGNLRIFIEFSSPFPSLVS